MIASPSSLAVPGALWGHYPENGKPWSERPVVMRWLKGFAQGIAPTRGDRSASGFVAAVRARGAVLRALDERQLHGVLHLLRGRLLRD
ncbi:MAG: hypothetical protein ABI478_07050, partial [Propionivibrio sp.]